MSMNNKAGWMTWAMVAACLSVVGIGCGGDDPAKADASVQGGEDSGSVDDPVNDGGTDGGLDDGGSDLNDGGQGDAGPQGEITRIEKMKVSKPGTTTCTAFCQSVHGECVENLLWEIEGFEGEYKAGAGEVTYGECKRYVDCDEKPEATIKCQGLGGVPVKDQTCGCGFRE